MPELETQNTTELPTDALADHVRKQCLLDADIRVLAPEGVDVDQYSILKEADVEDVEYADGGLHVWMEGETHVEEKVASSTRWQPAEYKNYYPDVLVGIEWSLDPEDQPVVTMEVEF